MTTYSKLTDFAAKDALLTGNPAKIVKGTEIGAEFDSIALADASNVKAPSSSTDNAVVRFNSTTGKLVKNSSVTISDTGVVSGSDRAASGANTDITSLASPSLANATATTQAVTDNSTKVATTAFVQAGTISNGQTWQQLSGSRAINTTYTNSTAKPICVAVTIGFNPGSEPSMLINGILMAKVSNPGTVTTQGFMFGIVPPGGTYYLNVSGSISYWAELR